jgi:hypothetical protein
MKELRMESIVVEGSVEHGDERGRLLGFPTANLVSPDAVERDGVYAGLVRVVRSSRRLAAEPRLAVVSVGRRPTYYGGHGPRLLEAHLLDWTGDLYGATIRVELHRRLRPQRRFDTQDDLIEQIREDVAQAASWAATSGLTPEADGAVPQRFGRWVRQGHESRQGSTLRGLTRRQSRLRALDDALRASSDDVVSHASVAGRAGLPEGYLRWLFPTDEALAAACRRES